MRTIQATTQHQALILKPRELDRASIKLPKSWEQAAGLLKHKKKALEKHLEKVRNEWR